MTRFSNACWRVMLVGITGAVRVCADSVSAQSMPEEAGFATNGPAVFRLARTVLSNSPTLASITTNAVFDHFLPDSLNHLVWTNFIAHTNGRSTTVWWERSHPANWPTNPPVAKWNPGSLLYGRRGWTAISPCWEGEVWSGQVPITALTRRHGYTRGHGMGDDGFSTNNIGRKVWFVTAKDELVTVKVLRQVVRFGGTNVHSRRDYTVFLFDRDLPAGIEPMGVAQVTNLLAKYVGLSGAPAPLFKTEQGGHVSAEVPGFTVPTWKGGDSGSPDMLPLPGELVFVGGRSTTGPTPGMQADMDELCRMQGLDPQRYQMRWADLSRFPDYGVRPK